MSGLWRCGQALAGNKAVKQHLNRQHPEVMSRVQQLITPRLQQHKVMMKKGSTCRYCQTKVDAPGRHSEQCVPLLQTHVLQEAQRQGLDMTSRAYEAQPKKPSKQNKAKAAPQVGLKLLSLSYMASGFWQIVEITAMQTRCCKFCTGLFLQQTSHSCRSRSAPVGSRISRQSIPLLSQPLEAGRLTGGSRTQQNFSPPFCQTSPPCL